MTGRFLVGVAVIAGAFSLGWVLQPRFKGNSEQPVLRMFTRYKIDFKKLEPASYQVADEYEYVSYLYSPLVEFNNEGQLVEGLAEKFYWQGSDLVFELRKDAVSSKGEPITADDVVASLKRINILDSSKSAHFFSEACRGNKLTKLSDNCEGIVGEGNKVTIKFSKKMPLYLDLFSNISFAIVPLKAIDQQTLHVIDIDNVSGPYSYSERNEALSLFKLEARKNHWHYSKKMPQKVLIKTFVGLDGGGASALVAATAMGNGEFDLWPTFGGAAGIANQVIDNPKYNKRYDIFITPPIGTYTVFFSNRAKKEFTAQERLHIGDILRSGFYKDSIRYTNGITKTNQIFSATSEASLTEDQRRIYEEALENSKNVPVHRKPILHVVKSYMEKIIQYIEATGGKIGYENDVEFDFPPVDAQQNRFDGFFTTINLSTIESLDSIFWLRSANWMPYSPEKNDEWIDQYLKEEDKPTRVALIKKLHLDMLLQGNLAPIDAMSYAAIVRKPWKLNFSKLFGSTPLWQIEYED